MIIRYFVINKSNLPADNIIYEELKHAEATKKAAEKMFESSCKVITLIESEDDNDFVRFMITNETNENTDNITYATKEAAEKWRNILITRANDFFREPDKYRDLRVVRLVKSN